MALNIKDPETDRLARKLADLTGESITAAVSQSVKERLERLEGAASSDSLLDELARISERCARLPLLDNRSDDEILGYGPDGIPV